MSTHACPPAEKGIADLKARAELGEIAGRYAALKRRGDELWARCPFHADEDTPDERGQT